jgi:predicted glycogen debranching enzyme
MKFEFGKESWRTFEQGMQKEWLLTNGLGGFSSSTIIGANTRRYHGLLVASLEPPVRRHLILSKIDENITIDGESNNLYSFKTPDYTMRGYLHLQRVIIDYTPTFIYSVGNVFIEKKISLVHGENTVVIVYRILNGNSCMRLKLTPLVNFRDYHHISSRLHMGFTVAAYDKGIVVTPDSTDIKINIFCSDGSFIGQDNSWFLNMDYAVERERGLQSTEDHYIPGYFEVMAKPGEEKIITIIATIEDRIKSSDGLFLIDEEEKRVIGLQKKAGYDDEFANQLITAADSFIVYRKSIDSKTVIAGYPWFTDWGRDTMIALPGLTLVTKRFDDAKKILSTFARHVKNGLIPNMFPEKGKEPAYNTVDAALWYFEACSKYLQYTDDYQFVRDNLFEVLKSIIKAFINGTSFNIKMDSDYLINAGGPGTQLTWMDAKVGDWVVTPRHGKAVEVNALWYNALMVMVKLTEKFNDDSLYCEEIAKKVKESFIKSFWNPVKRCLYDVIRDDFIDDNVRPNQVIAVSLSNPVLDGEMAENIVNTVWKELYAAYGLRTLSPSEKGYRGIYVGDQFNRDGAYHQGTVWAWLLGHFITAYVRVNDNTQKNNEIIRQFVEPFKDHLKDACVGYVSEIFDGDEPLTPRGCFAQAWSVSEVLRAYIEDICDNI